MKQRGKKRTNNNTIFHIEKFFFKKKEKGNSNFNENNHNADKIKFHINWLVFFYSTKIRIWDGDETNRQK